MRLTQLVARRESWGDDIATVIDKDKMLTGRLLSAANPRAESEKDYKFTTVQESLSRVGMNWVLLLAMVDPLMRAVTKTFSTMIAVELENCKLKLMTPLTCTHVVAEVGFTGKATGVVQLRMMPDTARLIASRLLGLAAEEVTDPDINDVIGEMGNVVGGNLKSNLCDANLDCKLSPPKISRTDSFLIYKPTGNIAERYGFRSPEMSLFVDISVNPKTA